MASYQELGPHPASAVLASAGRQLASYQRAGPHPASAVLASAGRQLASYSRVSYIARMFSGGTSGWNKCAGPSTYPPPAPNTQQYRSTVAAHFF